MEDSIKDRFAAWEKQNEGLAYVIAEKRKKTKHAPGPDPEKIVAPAVDEQGKPEEKVQAPVKEALPEIKEK